MQTEHVVEVNWGDPLGLGWPQGGHRPVGVAHAAAGRSSSSPGTRVMPSSGARRRSKPKLSRGKKHRPPSTSTTPKSPSIGGSAVKDAALLLLDISDRLPYRAVKSSSSKVWQKFCKQISACTTPQEVLIQAQWFLRQMKHMVVRGDWGGKCRSWEQECLGCDSSPLCLELVRRLESEAIDWDAVASNWALERGYTQADYLQGYIPNLEGAQMYDLESDDEDEEPAEAHPWQETRLSAEGSRVCTLWPKREGVPVELGGAARFVDVQFVLGVPSEDKATEEGGRHGSVAGSVEPMGGESDFVAWSQMEVEELPMSAVPSSLIFESKAMTSLGNTSYSVFGTDGGGSVAADEELQDSFESNLTDLLDSGPFLGGPVT